MEFKTEKPITFAGDHRFEIGDTCFVPSIVDGEIKVIRGIIAAECDVVGNYRFNRADTLDEDKVTMNRRFIFPTETICTNWIEMMKKEHVATVDSFISYGNERFHSSGYAQTIKENEQEREQLHGIDDMNNRPQNTGQLIDDELEDYASFQKKIRLDMQSSPIDYEESSSTTLKNTVSNEESLENIEESEEILLFPMSEEAIDKIKSLEHSSQTKRMSLGDIVNANTELMDLFIEHAISMYQQLFMKYQGYTIDDFPSIDALIDKIQDDCSMDKHDTELLNKIVMVDPRIVLHQTIKHHKFILDSLKTDITKGTSEGLKKTDGNNEWSESLNTTIEVSESIVGTELTANYNRVNQWKNLKGKVYKEKWTVVNNVTLTVQDGVSLFPYRCCEDVILDSMFEIMSQEMKQHSEMRKASFITSPAMAVFFSADDEYRKNVLRGIDKDMDIIVIPLLLTTFNTGHYNIIVVNKNPAEMTIRLFDPKQPDKINWDSLYASEIMKKLNTIRTSFEEYIGQRFNYNNVWPREQPYLRNNQVPLQEKQDIYSCGPLCIRFVEILIARSIQQKYFKITEEYRKTGYESLNSMEEIDSVANIFNFTEIDALRLRYFMELEDSKVIVP